MPRLQTARARRGLPGTSIKMLQCVAVYCSVLQSCIKMSRQIQTRAHRSRRKMRVRGTGRGFHRPHFFRFTFEKDFVEHGGHLKTTVRDLVPREEDSSCLAIDASGDERWETAV